MFNGLVGLFRRGAGTSKEWKNVVELDSPEALTQCLARSHAEPVFIFKHSTRCPISSGARREVERYLQEAGERALPVYINYVVEARAISNAIEANAGIRHESPQMLLLVSGRPVWNASHGGIRADALAGAAAAHGKSE